ncbi:MAG: haloacid dehalogenase-like hydrolase, partial [Bdellovibrionales bacterium]|nr:haloacid dehalogenase-like hydrolase [Bdellovibrionales bacterium]
MHDLSEQLVRKIILSLEKVIDESEGPFYAAFDADGTLWDTDIGENFFHYQIENRLVENLPPDPWEHYLKLKKEISPPAAYLWLAQINRGHSLEEVRAWSQECNKKGPAIPYLKGQKKIISFLHSKKVNVYVVSASIKWAIEPAAAIFDIPQERCLGVKTKIDPKGIITDIQDGPITWQKG